ncbi:MAG: serine/threonine-protein kinase [Kofleriaceae bacterium]
MVDEDDRPTTARTPFAIGGLGEGDSLGALDKETTMRDARLGPGAEVGGYVIDGELGRGGMGFVYSATHPVIGKRAAIKVLKPEVSKSPIAVERFIQEARAVNQIGHPNIIDIFAFGALPDGRAYHVMDLLVGESLRRRLRRGPLHPSEAASVIDEIASALAAAHDKGFIHRDIKPDNVYLVEHEGRWPEVKLLDFGLAKLMPEAGVAPFQTKAGAVLGTPEYMSPEQARGARVDHRTDLYALGVVTFEILAGARPFASSGSDPLAILKAHAEQPPPSLAALVPELPLELVQLVSAMLAKEPGARPSLAAVRTVLKRLRSTTLPSRSSIHLPALQMPDGSAGAIGAAYSSVDPLDPSRTSADPLDELTASRVGAEPMADLPSLRGPTLRHRSQPPPGHAAPAGYTAPAAHTAPAVHAAPAAHPAHTAPPPLAAHPVPAVHAAPIAPPLASAAPPGPPHGAAGHAASPHAVAAPSSPSYPSYAPPSAAALPPPPARVAMSASPDSSVASHAGALASSPSSARRLLIPSTALGVGVPLKPPPPPAPAPAPPPKSTAVRRWWLLLGALLAIATGIVLAIALADR